MMLILKFVISYLCLVKIISSKMMRVQPNDEIYRYSIDRNLPSYEEYFSTSTLLFEQIDDDKVELGGYAVFLKSMDPNLPMQLDVRTQIFENSLWNELPFRITLPSFCPELINPDRFWYNITKLWINNCPPQKGQKWIFEHQIIDIRINFPPSIPSGTWRVNAIVFQIGKVNKFGVTFQVEITEMF